MPDQQTMTEEQSLELIQQMIQAARDEHNDNGFGWRLWGWILFIASFGTFLSLEFNWKGSFWLWNAVLPVGVVLMILSGIFRKKRHRNLTYARSLLDKMGVGFFASLFATILGINLFFTSEASPDNVEFWGFFYILYAFWMYIHGSALKFRPLIFGAILNWIAGIAMFRITDMKFDMLLGAMAILFGYLIPGYLLYFQSRAAQKKKHV
ncbi:hypothetical protein KJS94_17100 [Flavihumibacter rivuli]|uniref:hypothetical protein n=1 Tax=Flavihumibacter rivuli TaxID=2838156 RepID=UPI001BDE4D59|nr:hypothetical protein [Flavihumibacter rivuli]ULQ56370.1 hypothetical protein KJS94_17100 [Flavihumibacter rivuli]